MLCVTFKKIQNKFKLIYFVCVGYRVKIVARIGRIALCDECLKMVRIEKKILCIK